MSRETKQERAERRARVHYKPGVRPRSPRVDDAAIRSIASGYLKPSGVEPSADDLDEVIVYFDCWREWEPRRCGRPAEKRRVVLGRNRRRLERYLDWVLMWDRKGYVAADARPIKLRTTTPPRGASPGA